MGRSQPPPSEELNPIIDQLFRTVGDIHRELAAASAEHGLTVQQGMLLRSLDKPTPMRALAQELSCDPSTVTGLVDRIERLGLIERLTDQTDRRIRLLTLTAKGQHVRDTINDHLATRTAAHCNLGTEDLRHLHNLLAKLYGTH
jgi:Transcriptional regulators